MSSGTNDLQSFPARRGRVKAAKLTPDLVSQKSRFLLMLLAASLALAILAPIAVLAG